MAKIQVPKGWILQLMEKMGINPEGYGVEFEGDNLVTLLHYKTHNEVTISKAGKMAWL